MPNRTSKGKKKRESSFKNLDLIDNVFYSKLIILISLGFDTYNKLQEFKGIEEGRKIHYANLNVQMGRLLDNGIIREGGGKLKFNKKRFEVDKNMLGDLFFDRILGYMQERDNLRDKYNRENKKSTFLDFYKANPHMSRKELNKRADYVDRKLGNIEIVGSKAPLKKELIREKQEDIVPYILEYLMEYFRMCPSVILLNKPLSYHFEQVIKEMLYFYWTNMNIPGFKDKGDTRSSNIAYFLMQLDHVNKLPGSIPSHITDKYFTYEQKESIAEEPRKKLKK